MTSLEKSYICSATWIHPNMCYKWLSFKRCRCYKAYKVILHSKVNCVWFNETSSLCIYPGTRTGHVRQSLILGTWILRWFSDAVKAYFQYYKDTKNMFGVYSSTPSLVVCNLWREMLFTMVYSASCGFVEICCVLNLHYIQQKGCIGQFETWVWIHPECIPYCSF